MIFLFLQQFISNMVTALSSLIFQVAPNKVCLCLRDFYYWFGDSAGQYCTELRTTYFHYPTLLFPKLLTHHHRNSIQEVILGQLPQVLNMLPHWYDLLSPFRETTFLFSSLKLKISASLFWKPFTQLNLFHSDNSQIKSLPMRAQQIHSSVSWCKISVFLLLHSTPISNAKISARVKYNITIPEMRYKHQCQRLYFS